MVICSILFEEHCDGRMPLWTNVIAGATWAGAGRAFGHAAPRRPNNRHSTPRFMFELSAPASVGALAP